MDQVVVFNVADEVYGMDITSVQEIQGATKPTPLPFAEYWHEGVVNIRGSLYTVVNLGKKLNISNRDGNEQDKFIVMHTHRLAFVVDHVQDIANADESVVHEKPHNLNGEMITCMFESKNRMIPVLNIEAIIASTRLQTHS